MTPDQLHALGAIMGFGDDEPVESELSAELRASLQVAEEAKQVKAERNRKARQTWARNERAGKHQRGRKELDFSRAWGGRS